MRYIDPDGRADILHITFSSRGFNVGWSEFAPQAALGYANLYDDLANRLGIVDIHATTFDLGGGIELRFWKGDYRKYGGGAAGEFGFYNYAKPITIFGIVASSSMNGSELKKRYGLTNTTINVWRKDGVLLATWNDSSSYWTHIANPGMAGTDKNDICTENIFNFETEGQAIRFMNSLDKAKRNAQDTRLNPWVGSDVFSIRRDGTQVIVTWGDLNE